jgi:hypothetical protein
VARPFACPVYMPPGNPSIGLEFPRHLRTVTPYGVGQFGVRFLVAPTRPIRHRGHGMGEHPPAIGEVPSVGIVCLQTVVEERRRFVSRRRRPMGERHPSLAATTFDAGKAWHLPIYALSDPFRVNELFPSLG